LLQLAGGPAVPPFLACLNGRIAVSRPQKSMQLLSQNEDETHQESSGRLWMCAVPSGRDVFEKCDLMVRMGLTTAL
jgi:hypothetical protein